MFIFSEEKRPKLQQERPDLSDSELTRLLARMWNELPDKKKVSCQSPLPRRDFRIRRRRKVFVPMMLFWFRRNINGSKSS